MSRPGRPFRRRPLVIAHRGASGELPENTLPAFERAVEQQADMIEVDLHTTRDGEVVIRHDAELESLGGAGEIGGATGAEVRGLDAGAGARVPLLDEMLDGFAHRIPFNLELKIGGGGRYPGMEEVAVAAVRSRGVLDQTLFSSFYEDVLEALRAVGPKVRIAVLVAEAWPAGMFERALRLRAEAVNPFHRLVDAELVRRAHGEGMMVYPYTVDEASHMERLLDLGVDGLFTNHPERMRQLLAARE